MSAGVLCRGAHLVTKSDAYPALPTWLARAIHVGVTGTNGKTTTAHWIAAILNAAAPPVAVMTTTGSLLGAQPFLGSASLEGQLSLIRELLQRGGRYAVLETTSEVLARGLAAVWPYRLGVFTNLTQDHLDAHRSLEHYFASKAQLFRHLPTNGAAIINACDEVAPLLVEVIPPGVQLLTYGLSSRGNAELPVTLRAEAVQLSFGGTSAQLEAPQFGLTGRTLRVPAIGAIYIENALAALGAALSLGVSAETALAALEDAPIPRGRFEIVHRHPDVVVDYAHTPDALVRTLTTARALCRGKLWLICGAGGNRDRLKRPMLGLAAEAADHIVLTSDNPRGEDPESIANEMKAGMQEPDRASWIGDRKLAIERVLSRCESDDILLIAGKGHEETQTDRGGTRPFSDRAVAEAALEQRFRS